MRHECHAQAEKKRWWNEGSGSRYQMLGPAQGAWRTHGPSALTSRLPRIFGSVEIALFLWYGWIARLQAAWWKDTDIRAGTWGGESISLGCFEGARCSKTISLAHLLLLPRCFSPSEVGFEVYDCHCCLWHKWRTEKGHPAPYFGSPREFVASGWTKDITSPNKMCSPSC